MAEIVTNKDTEEKSRDVLIYHFAKWTNGHVAWWNAGATFPKEDEKRPTYENFTCAFLDVKEKSPIPFSTPPKREMALGEALDLKNRIRAVTVAVDAQTGKIGVAFCSMLDQFNRAKGRDIALRRMALKIDWKMTKESTLQYFQGRLYFHPLRVG